MKRTTSIALLTISATLLGCESTQKAESIPATPLVPAEPSSSPSPCGRGLDLARSTQYSCTSTDEVRLGSYDRTGTCRMKYDWDPTGTGTGTGTAVQLSCTRSSTGIMNRFVPVIGQA